MQAMRERYPDVRLHLVESLSGHLATMLNARQLDLAVLFDTDRARRWSVLPLLDEKLFLIRRAPAWPGLPAGRACAWRELAGLPLILPSGPHGLRSTLDAAFARARIVPRRRAPRSTAWRMLMDAVRAGLGCTIQPGAALARLPDAHERCALVEIADAQRAAAQPAGSLSDDELSPAALAARVVLADVARAAGREAALGRRAAFTNREDPLPGAVLRPTRAPTVRLHARGDDRCSMCW